MRGSRFAKTRASASASGRDGRTRAGFADGRDDRGGRGCEGLIVLVLIAVFFCESGSGGRVKNAAESIADPILWKYSSVLLLSPGESEWVKEGVLLWTSYGDGALREPMEDVVENKSPYGDDAEVVQRQCGRLSVRRLALP